MSAVDVIAQTLFEHRRRGPWECACGDCHLYDGDRIARDEKLAAHQAQAVTEALGLVDREVAAKALREAAAAYRAGIHVDSIPKWLDDLATDAEKGDDRG